MHPSRGYQRSYVDVAAIRGVAIKLARGPSQPQMHRSIGVSGPSQILGTLTSRDVPEIGFGNIRTLLFLTLAGSGQTLAG